MKQKSLLLNILFFSAMMISFAMTQNPGDDEDEK